MKNLGIKTDFWISMQKVVALAGNQNVESFIFQIFVAFQTFVPFCTPNNVFCKFWNIACGKIYTLYYSINYISLILIILGEILSMFSHRLATSF